MKLNLDPARLGLVAAVTAVGMVITAPAWGDPQDDKRRVDRHLVKARSTLEAATGRAKNAAEAYAEANGKLPGARKALAEARGLVAASEVRANRARRDADTAKRTLTTAKDAYQDAEAEVSMARDRVGKFVSAAYKGNHLVAFDSVLDAKTPSDLADRMAFLDDVAASQRAALDKVIKLRHAAKLKENDATVTKRQADRAKRLADDALAAAKQARDSAERAAANVKTLVSTRKQSLGVAKEEREKTLKRYRALQRRSERIAAEIRALADKDKSSGGGRHHSGARFLMPAQGWKSSDFGRRWDPYYHVWQLHAGVDIAAPGGQAIRAADSGRVFRAGWNGGYGNYTCVYHGLSRGRGLATCYAHQSRILVSSGQRVSRGQVIGRVGTTGASTGNHLHFEVRLNGNPVNPLGWLPRCFC
ncbi:MAG: peptidoglycan DD-metalloendopeptidase family protein [Micromonosporaceae bacterium]|nr:peptidoglycan DD-metalloendopeptidase family protein [Micromonosporaceae bacterium]